MPVIKLAGNLLKRYQAVCARAACKAAVSKHVFGVAVAAHF